MRVLVTGGSGAIGSMVVEACLDRGHDVAVFDLRVPSISGVSHVEGDVTDESQIAAAMADADAAIHMAALLPETCEAEPQRAVEVNVGGVVCALDAALETDTRLVNVSSVGVFGGMRDSHAHPQYEPLSEEAEPRRPKIVYGITKLAGERFCEKYVREHDLQVISVRFPSTYGPEQGRRYGNLAVVSNAIERAARGERVELAGGDQPAEYIYTGDIGNGLAAAVETDEWTYTTYHIGTGRLVTLHDFAAALNEHADGEVEIDGGLDFRGGGTYCRMDISRARSDLGYEPQYSVEDGVENMVERIAGD